MTAKTLVVELIGLHVNHPDYVEDHPRAIGRKELLIDAIMLAWKETHAAAADRLEREIRHNLVKAS